MSAKGGDRERDAAAAADGAVMDSNLTAAGGGAFADFAIARDRVCRASVAVSLHSSSKQPAKQHT